MIGDENTVVQIVHRPALMIMISLKVVVSGSGLFPVRNGVWGDGVVFGGLVWRCLTRTEGIVIG